MFPAALAVAQETGATGKDFIVACVVGYEFACRFGERLGKSHYEVSPSIPALQLPSRTSYRTLSP